MKKYKSVRQFIEDNREETHRKQSKYLGETLKVIAESIDSIIVRQRTAINELNDKKFKCYETEPKKTME